MKVLVRALRSGEDSIVQHYVAQTIDNLASQTNDHVGKLATYELITALMGVMTSAQVTLNMCVHDLECVYACVCA